MASVEFSLGFRTGLPSRLLRYASIGEAGNAYQDHGLLSHSIYGIRPFFYIFSGSKKTVQYCRDNTNSSNLINNNCLIKFTIEDLGNTTLTGADFIKFVSLYKQATKSGLATWFCFSRQMNDSTNQTTMTMGAHSIIGDIGLIGSGADLELPDTNIVLGQNYRIDNFKINIPYSWTY